MIAESIALLIEEMDYEVVGMALDVSEAQEVIWIAMIRLIWHWLILTWEMTLLDRSGIVFWEIY